jgi:hypothetical protein
MAESDTMGTPTLGKFIALISILPVAFLLPLGLFYWLQYLGRVIVSSAGGDTMPPRTPDRNFDGFFNGLSPWYVWLFLGESVSLLPVALYWLSSNSPETWNRLLSGLLFVLGVPYTLMALMLSFLHDHALAANPMGVIGAMLRLKSSFLLLCGFVVWVVAVSLGSFALALQLRANHFWLYLMVCVPCWIGAAWSSIVVMRVLGLYYFHRRELLKWHHERPRWGVAWKI